MKKAERANYPEFEQEMLNVWKDEDTFRKSLQLREGAPRFSFYDGPPFANGQPHFGHSLVTSIKDALGRYKTMRGYYVERRNGWDTHGLPVEFAIEKQFGVSGKKQIQELGIDKFNDACRASVFTYKHDWEDFFGRIGRWTDTENAYVTMDRDYTESVWWMLSRVNEKGLLYRGYKSMPYCPRCETPLSNFELNEGYRDNVPDPSVFVKFELEDQPGTSLLGWTTTPWTLPANAALAIDPEADYVTVELKKDGDGWKAGEKLVLAGKRLEVLDLHEAEYEVTQTRKGSELLGLKYKPLYELPADVTGEEAGAVHRVYADDSVSLDDGTGILHVAPRYGETDLALGQREGLPLILSAGSDGRMVDAMGEFAGQFFKDADPHITRDLTEKGRIFAAETFTHTYPFCYRCETPLLYFAISSWYIRVSEIRDELLRTAEDIEWTPGHIKRGRFGKWLEGARDWAISRNRYWGAPLPIWVNTEDENDYLVVGSLDELVELAGLEGKPEDVHRPGIDKIEIKRDGKTYKRVEEVFDCWFESGSMSAAQQHYPFERQDVFEESFPADYIGEGLDQTRLWFYVQHVLSTIVFGKPAYKHVLVNGMVMAADGQKLSKRLKNYPPVEDVFSTEGADALRYYLLSNDQAVGADYMRFNRDAMGDVQRNVFSTLWNSYSFLSMYAQSEGWAPGRTLERPVSGNVLDEWVLARLDETVAEMTRAADAYELAQALRPFGTWVDDLSNWYLRRSRKRFKGEDEGDKTAAFETLHYVLAVSAQLLAPWAPFLGDKLWRGLTEGMDVPASVHLTDWPEAREGDRKVLADMARARDYIAQALAKRAEEKIRIRQPLPKVTLSVLPEQYAAIIADEVNVKEVVFTEGAEGVELDTEITPELRREGIARDVVRLVQDTRKKAGMRPGERIELGLSFGEGADELRAAVEEHWHAIAAEALAVNEDIEPAGEGAQRAKAGGGELFILVTPH